MADNGGYAKPTSWSAPTGSRSTPTTPASCSPRSTRTPSLYDDGHMPGASALHWKDELQQQVDARRASTRARVRAACSASKGIANDTTVVLYGDKNNWFAALRLLVPQAVRARDVRIMDGGRQKWIDEDRDAHDRRCRACAERRTTRSRRRPARSAPGATTSSRSSTPERRLVDVRSPQEYSGELIAMPGYQQEGAQRGGHIPGAASIPWAQAVREDGTFKSADELRELYSSEGRRRSQADRPRTAGSASARATLVRAARAARLPARAQLRRLVDRVGQPGRRADRGGR